MVSKLGAQPQVQNRTIHSDRQINMSFILIFLFYFDIQMKALSSNISTHEMNINA